MTNINPFAILSQGESWTPFQLIGGIIAIKQDQKSLNEMIKIFESK